MSFNTGVSFSDLRVLKKSSVQKICRARSSGITTWRFQGAERHAYTHTANRRQVAFPSALGTDAERMDDVVRAENDRLASRAAQPRHHRTGPMRGSSAAPAERRKPGTKPGFKRGDTNKDDGRRRKPGPKEGSHSVRTTGRKASQGVISQSVSPEK